MLRPPRLPPPFPAVRHEPFVHRRPPRLPDLTCSGYIPSFVPSFRILQVPRVPRLPTACRALPPSRVCRSFVPRPSFPHAFNYRAALRLLQLPIPFAFVVRPRSFAARPTHTRRARARLQFTHYHDARGAARRAARAAAAVCARRRARTRTRTPRRSAPFPRPHARPFRARSRAARGAHARSARARRAARARCRAARCRLPRSRAFRRSTFVRQFNRSQLYPVQFLDQVLPSRSARLPPVRLPSAAPFPDRPATCPS